MYIVLGRERGKERENCKERERERPKGERKSVICACVFVHSNKLPLLTNFTLKPSTISQPISSLF